MFTFNDQDYTVAITVKGQSLTIKPVKESLGDFHPSVLTTPELVTVFNDMVSFLKGAGYPDKLPEPVTRFADKLVALKRVGALHEVAQGWLRKAQADNGGQEPVSPEPVQLEPVEAVQPEPVVVEAEPVIEDRPTRPAKVVPARKPKAAPPVEPDTIVEVVGGLKNLPPKTQRFTDKCNWLVGKRQYEDNWVITKLIEAPTHKDSVERFKLYRDGMTVAEFIADAMAYARTLPRYAGKPDAGNGGLRWVVFDWLAGDAKRTNRISITPPQE